MDYASNFHFCIVYCKKCVLKYISSKAFLSVEHHIHKGLKSLTFYPTYKQSLFLFILKHYSNVDTFNNDAVNKLRQIYLK